MKKSYLFLLSLLLIGCNKNNDNIMNEDKNIEIDILKETLPNNDSGVENPQHEFYEIFGERDADIEPPEGYFEMDMNYEEARLEGVQTIFGEELTVKIYETYEEYKNADVLTDDLYEKMKVLTDEIVVKAKESGYDLEKEMGGHPFYFLDFDEDGLPDYYEKEVYGSDPSKKSTSGDIYNDCYKVEHNMDLFTYYEQEWVELDDNFQIMGDDMKSNELLGCDTYPDYLDNSLVEYLVLGLNFQGKVRYKSNINTDINNLEISVYNPGKLEYAKIEYKIVDDYIEFYVDRGYCYYLVYDKSVDIDKLLSLYKRNE